MQAKAYPINSRPWWEEYFTAEWDANGGGDQTRHFMERLLAGLSAPETAFLQSRPLSILDWGCAFGEGVELLAQAFHQSRVVGLDFASTAIEQARQRHPNREFVMAESGEISEEFDVIVTSNCLEHFEHPLEIIRTHLQSCRALYVALVPYNEFPLSEYHRSQFKEESFPERLGSFARICTQLIDTDPVYWNGPQLLVVYGSDSYFRERISSEHKELEQQKWDHYYSSLPLFGPDEATEAFGNELAERVSELLPEGARILEAGCGGGWQSLALARSGRFKVSLMDFSRQALQYARRLFEREHLPAEFIYGDVFTPSAPQFDLVFNAGVLEHYTLDEQASFLRGMASRSRNYVMALVPNRSCYWYWLWRIQKSSNGEWPFGKEVPLGDFSTAFRTADLQFLGQTFMAERWAEFFIKDFAGANQQLSNRILEIGRSPLIPREQKSYLLAGLATVSSEELPVPSVWTSSPTTEDMQIAEIRAALGDALALRIGAEQEVSRLQTRQWDAGERIELLSSELAGKNLELIERRHELVERERRLSERDQELVDKNQQLVEKHRELVERGQELSEKNQELVEKHQELAKKEQELSEKDQEVVEKDQELSGKSQQLVEKHHELARKEQELSERDQELVETHQKVARQEQEFLEKNQQLTEKKQELVEKQQELGEKCQQLSDSREELGRKQQELLEKKHELIEKDQKLAEEDRELAAQQERIGWLSSEITKAERSVDILSEQLAGKDLQLGLIFGSRSWRIVRRLARLKHRYLMPPYRLLSPLAKRATAKWGIESIEKIEPESTTLPPDPAPVRLIASIPRDTRPTLPKSDVVCFSIVDWDFRFQRPQQLMSRFADAGHRVFYVSQKFRADRAYALEEKGTNIYEVSLNGLERNVYTDMLDDEARDALLASLDALRRDLSLGATVAFVQLPFWWPLVNEARNQFAWPVVYDCMDHHRGFSTNEQGMLDHENDLMTSADLIVTSSDFLEEQASRHNSNVLMVRNACDYEHFANVGRATGVRRVVGYYGAIADWFDSDLVADLAERRPDWDFVLVGSTFSADVGRLSRLPNVALPGEKPYSEIPSWLSKFDVAIIPFKRNPLTNATNPVKAYEILAGGKPLVSVPIPEMNAFAPLVRLASTVEEFEKEICEALDENGAEIGAKRRAFARENTWEKRYEILAPAVRSAFPRASIIIVTFNNLKLNQLCLESLYARTEWPNFEVVVVDNGSSDGTSEYLEEAKNSFPNLRVVLNKTNLGFAAANNIGLDLATGDYLVLLNNDTVVARGWLSALIRHLRCNPNIGMIGPVTNAIANEAKVEVDYSAIDDMPVWAADYVRKHDAQVLPIPMLAMFCVAMRRAVFDQVGLLDERFGLGMFEDDDYSRRLLEAGYELRFTHDSFVHHWQRASFRLIADEEYLRIYRENQDKYEKKWERRPAIRTTIMNLFSGQLKEVLAKVERSKGAVIFLPSIGWNIHLFQRPHHLAREFARRGYVSIFDSSNSNDEVDGFKEIEPNLFLFHGPEERLHEIPNSVLWTFPYNFDRKDFYPKTSRTIYDWVDDLEVFPYDRSFLDRNHRRGLREASTVVSVALSLHKLAVATRPDATYLPNGVEYERFASEAVTPDDGEIEALLGEGKPIAGYYGALAEWFDYTLLDEVACLRPDWNFLLIGQSLDQSLSEQRLLNRHNVRWIGPRRYDSLPGYLRTFDVATIPFVINNITEATSPLKLYEYFAAGKAVITTAMPECESFSEVRIVRSAGEFSQALDRAKEQGKDEEYRTRVRAIARENSWTVRIQTVERILQQPEPPNQKGTQSLRPGGTGLDVQGRPQRRLVGAAAELADRFRHFRTNHEGRFFEALCNHFSTLKSDACLPMYFEFAITCNERGRHVATLLEKHTKLCAKRYLDVGCAYAGFLVAFAEQGAEVVGIDTDELLLTLAQPNLLDNNVKASLLKKDATRFEELEEFRNSFDIITCNDVIEHVDDPQSLLSNIARMLRDDGVAYFEIPNRFHPRHVLQDGHYQLFGITLLDYPQAREYYSLHAPGVPYGVRHYLELQQYTRMFEEAGMTLTVMEESFGALDMQVVLNDIAELRASAQTALERVPQAIRHRVEENLSRYLNEIENLSVTPEQQADFRLRYGLGFWQVLARKGGEPTKSVMALAIVSQNEHRPRASSIERKESPVASNTQRQSSVKRRRACFNGMSAHPGRCNICGNDTLFFYNNPALYRESLNCGECLSTSRYRSIAKGILQAIRALTGINAKSVAELDPVAETVSLSICDTQVPFYFETCAYPIPDLLSSCKWIELQTSTYRPQQPCGVTIGRNTTNQNLEALTYSDRSFDIVITSDVMEHVRLDNRAHQEIRRVLKPGGIYLFTVPHFRDRNQTFFRVAVTDPDDPAKDAFLTEKEYHGDANSEDGRALSYRSYGTDIDETLRALGFDVDYCKTDLPELGIMNTELFFCRLRR